MEARMRNTLGVALALLLGLGLLTLWVREQWPVSAVQVGIYLLTAIWLAGVVLARLPLRFHPMMLPLAGAAGWGCVQLAANTTIYRWATELAVLDWFTRLTVFVLAYQLFTDRRLGDRFLRWLLWFGFVLAVAAILQRYTSPDRVFWLFDVAPGGLTMGPFVYHNQYAAFIETVLPLALWAALRKGDSAGVVMAGVMIASVIAAMSRAGTALVLAETALVFVLTGRGQRQRRRRLLMQGAVTMVLALVFAASVGWQPLSEKFDRQSQLAERRNLYLSTIEMTRDRPLMGFGLATWPTAYPAYATFDDGRRDNQAHSDWLQWASEGGIPMLALMLLMGGMLLRPALRSVWGVGLLAVLLHCLVDYHFQQRPVFGYYYFALAGLVCAFAAEDDGDSARQDVQLQPE